MAGRSNIEWTELTWNPIVGCSIISPGCTHCYAMRMAARIEAMNAGEREKGKQAHAPHYDGTTKKVNGRAIWTGKMAKAPEHILLAPLRRKKPTMYFVNSMSDLFHEDVPDEWINNIFAVMALCPQHTFQVLTKRAERMRDYMSKIDGETAEETRQRFRRAIEGYDLAAGELKWPLSQVWLGVSCERQQEADERIPLLLQTPAAVRFISAEPLLGPIRFYSLGGEKFFTNPSAVIHDALGGFRSDRISTAKLDWVIVGGESGHGARPFDIDWARSIVQQCEAASVPAFMKQLGSNPHSNGRPMYGAPKGKYDDPAAWPAELRVRQFPPHVAEHRR